MKLKVMLMGALLLSSNTLLAQAIKDGRYALINRNSNLALDVVAVSKENGALLHQWGYAGSSNQQFDVSHQGNGYYSVKAVHSGKVLDVAGVSLDMGAPIQQYTWANQANQLWYIASIDTGYYTLTAKHSGQAMEVWQQSKVNGGEIRQYRLTNGLNQQWKFQAVGSSSSAASSSTPATGSGAMLTLDGNPAASWLTKSRTKWNASRADIVTSYQQSNGGWPKNLDYNSVGAGSGGSDSGTIDNGATITEMVYLAEVYKTGKNTKYRDAVRRAANFIVSSQYSTGALPQFYPLKGGYADHATFNDNGMAYALTVLDYAANKRAPFDTDVFSDADRAKFKTAVTKGVDYILKAQWKQNGKLTAWCAQHGATDYKPKPARAYELESLSGSESAGVLAFLMTQPQTTQIQAAVKAGLNWFNSPSTYLDGYTYDSSMASTNPIVKKSGSRMWYRFYDLNTNRGFFSDRDGSKFYDITQMSEERRTGYSWGGAYGEAIISYGKKVGYL